MRRNELTDALAKGAARDGGDVRLGAAAVGDNGFRPEIRRDARHDFGHLADRRGDQDQIGIRDLLAGVGPDAIDDPEIERLRQRPQTPAEADNFLDLFGRFQRQRKRAANQPDTEDDDLAELRTGVHYCANSSASRKRAFSFSLPIVTRSHSGIP